MQYLQEMSLSRAGGGWSGTAIGLSALGSWFVSKTGKIVPVLLVLFVVMLLDYVTGLVKAGVNGKISSGRGFAGLRKKLMYGVMVAMAMTADFVIFYVGHEFGFSDPAQAYFAVLVSFWLILNESISILENLAEIGVPMPEFLVRVFERMKEKVEKSSQEQNESEE